MILAEKMRKMASRRTQIIESVKNNKLPLLYTGNYNFIVLTAPCEVVNLWVNDTLTNEFSDFLVNTPEFRGWHCILCKTIQEANELAITYPNYDFIIIDITNSQVKRLKVNKKKTVEIVPTENVTEEISDVILEDIGD
jgi:hypothetical protein